MIYANLSQDLPSGYSWGQHHGHGYWIVRDSDGASGRVYDGIGRLTGDAIDAAIAEEIAEEIAELRFGSRTRD